MSDHKSGNEIVAEAADEANAGNYFDNVLYETWKDMIERAVKQNGKTMDDKIFVMNEDGTMYDVDVGSDTDDAYNRAMNGI